MSDTAISLNNVSKYYNLYNSPKDRIKEGLHPFGKLYHKKFYALKDINLEIKKGEVLGVVGKNGSGKSTLLKLITKVLSPNAGIVKTKGKISALLELGAGFNPEFTGLENIYFYGMILGFSETEMDEKLDGILTFADIGDFIYQPIKIYSSGMKSRLGFAVAVNIDPEILILDEVLSVGDVVFKRKCFARIDEMFRSDKTIILVSHSANAIVQYCNRAILLHENHIYAENSPKEIINLYEHLVFDKSYSKVSSPGFAPADNSVNASPVQASNDLFEGEAFIANLNSVPMYINPHVAQIFDIMLKNSKGAIVNILNLGIRYTLSCSIVFKQQCHRVSFGAHIKTLNGFLVSGASTERYQQQVIEITNKNDRYNIEWEFDCRLVAGAYAMKVFIMSDNEDDTVIINDALLFKVAPNQAKNGGVVNLNQKIRIMDRENKPVTLISTN